MQVLENSISYVFIEQFIAANAGRYLVLNQKVTLGCNMDGMVSAKGKHILVN